MYEYASHSFRNTFPADAMLTAGGHLFLSEVFFGAFRQQFVWVLVAPAKTLLAPDVLMMVFLTPSAGDTSAVKQSTLRRERVPCYLVVS